MDYFRAAACMTTLATAALFVSCSPSHDRNESGADQAQTSEPQMNGLPPDQFLAEFGAMGYRIDAPWGDKGGNAWGAEAHKQIENNQLTLVVGSGTASRADQIELNAIVADGALTPPMKEAFELGIRTVFAGMELRSPDKVVQAANNASPFTGEAGRFGVQIVRTDDAIGGYTLSLRMASR